MGSKEGDWKVDKELGAGFRGVGRARNVGR